MFLDEKLLNIAYSTNNSNINENIVLMFQTAKNDLFEKIGGSKDFRVHKAQYKRVNEVWIKVAKQLEAEGIGLITESGFKDIVLKIAPDLKIIFE